MDEETTLRIEAMRMAVNMFEKDDTLDILTTAEVVYKFLKGEVHE